MQWFTNCCYYFKASSKNFGFWNLDFVICIMLFVLSAHQQIN
jgi:hypothetical protein